MTPATPMWNPEDVTAVVRQLYEPGVPAKYIDVPKARSAFFQVDKVPPQGAPVGPSQDLGSIVNEQGSVSLATVDREVAAPGPEVTVLWGENLSTGKSPVERHGQVEIRASVAPALSVQEVRDSYRTS